MQADNDKSAASALQNSESEHQQIPCYGDMFLPNRKPCLSEYFGQPGLVIEVLFYLKYFAICIGAATVKKASSLCKGAKFGVVV